MGISRYKESKANRKNWLMLNFNMWVILWWPRLLIYINWFKLQIIISEFFLPPLGKPSSLVSRVAQVFGLPVSNVTLQSVVPHCCSFGLCEVQIPSFFFPKSFLCFYTPRVNTYLANNIRPSVICPWLLVRRHFLFQLFIPSCCFSYPSLWRTGEKKCPSSFWHHCFLAQTTHSSEVKQTNKGTWLAQLVELAVLNLGYRDYLKIKSVKKQTNKKTQQHII